MQNLRRYFYFILFETRKPHEIRPLMLWLSSTHVMRYILVSRATVSSTVKLVVVAVATTVRRRCRYRRCCCCCWRQVFAVSFGYVPDFCEHLSSR